MEYKKNEGLDDQTDSERHFYASNYFSDSIDI